MSWSSRDASFSAPPLPTKAYAKRLSRRSTGVPLSVRRHSVVQPRRRRLKVIHREKYFAHALARNDVLWKKNASISEEHKAQHRYARLLPTKCEESNGRSDNEYSSVLENGPGR